MSNACLLYGFLGMHEGSEKLVDQGLRGLLSAIGGQPTTLQFRSAERVANSGPKKGFCKVEGEGKLARWSFGPWISDVEGISDGVLRQVGCKSGRR